MKKIFFTVCSLFAIVATVAAQDVKELIRNVKTKYDQVNDYEATGKLKTNVAFIKAPVATVKVYYKKPDRLKIKNETGISFIPRGSVNINMNNVLTLTDYQAVDGGLETVTGVRCRVVRIFPNDDNADITRSTLYIDAQNLLLIKSVVSTRENGTYDLMMSYGKYASLGLPDKTVFSFNTKDYKLPKGVTIDYDNGSSQSDNEKLKNKKGKVEISYSNYKINKGIADEIFK
jgi:outer membrane lipoprotein-sorting protein